MNSGSIGRCLFEDEAAMALAKAAWDAAQVGHQQEPPQFDLPLATAVWLLSEKDGVVDFRLGFYAEWDDSDPDDQAASADFLLRGWSVAQVEEQGWKRPPEGVS